MSFFTLDLSSLSTRRQAHESSDTMSPCAGQAMTRLQPGMDELQMCVREMRVHTTWGSVGGTPVSCGSGGTYTCGDMGHV